MELTPDQQIFEQIKKSNKILIFLPALINADNLASSLALRAFLVKLQKDVTLVGGGVIAENLKFLPGVTEVKHSLALGKSFVISVDTLAKKVEEISYHTAENKLHIYLKSHGGDFTKEDVTFATEGFPADLIFTIDCKSLDSLGKVYEQNAELLFSTPKINIDNQPGNEYYGAINLVDVNASSIAEILAELFQKFEQQLVDEDVATCLLTGIISKTNSFQHSQTTPRAFLKASELVAMGGRQQEIVKNIFKTKSLPLLKLWGRALARMRIVEEVKAIYTVLNYSDFEKAQGGEGEVLSVLKEFIDNVSGYKIVSLISESSKGIITLTSAVHEQVAIDKFIENFPGSKVFEFNLGRFKVVQVVIPNITQEAVETKILETLKTI